MIKVVHLIPFDGVGGVEVAARSIKPEVYGDIDFQVHYIFNNIDLSKNYFAIFNPLRMIAAAWMLARSDIDLLVVSLWRASIVGLFVKLLRPKLKLVTFLHLDKNVHIVDSISTYLSVKLSTEVWADSQTTLSKRIPNLGFIKGRVISFVTQNFLPLPERNVNPSFVFWGRLNHQKDLFRALHVFAAILECRPDAKFTIIGPDAGVLNDLKNLVVSLGLSESVIFIGYASHNQIIGYARQASFYLQTSITEGMAMSVVEAMQFGLVPVVTPVGEIASYCRHGFNAVVISSENQSIKAILTLLEDNNHYQEMRRHSIATWLDKPIYKDSILMACNSLVCDLEHNLN